MQPLQIHQIEKIIINDAKNNATGEMHAKLNTYEKVSLIYYFLKIGGCPGLHIFSIVK